MRVLAVVDRVRPDFFLLVVVPLGVIGFVVPSHGASEVGLIARREIASLGPKFRAERLLPLRPEAILAP